MTEGPDQSLVVVYIRGRITKSDSLADCRMALDMGKKGGKNKKSMAWTEQICKIIYGPAITQIFVQECIVLFFIQVLGGFKLCKKHAKASPRSPFNRY